MTETIYTQEPGKYHVQKTVGGYVVVFVSDRNTVRNVDGGKVHKSRQNAYAKAKRLNDSRVHALVEQFNDLTIYGAPREEYEAIVRELAVAGYGLRKNENQEYELTNIPDLSIIE